LSAACHKLASNSLSCSAVIYSVMSGIYSF
jgi:hypothetical protein